MVKFVYFFSSIIIIRSLPIREISQHRYPILVNENWYMNPKNINFAKYVHFNPMVVANSEQTTIL